VGGLDSKIKTSEAGVAEMRAKLVTAILAGDKFAEHVLDDVRMASGEVPLRTARHALLARKLHIEGDGDGYGTGYGTGDGYGSGYGDGDGYGDGYGYGDGCGDGYGSVAGYGSGAVGAYTKGGKI